MPDAILHTQDNIGKALTKASEIYSSNSFVRAAITAIPYVGGSIDILLSNRAQSIFQKRIMFFIFSLAKELETLKVDEVNKEYFESDEGIDLLLKAFDAAIKTRNEEKLALYSKILRGASETKNKETNMGESFLTVLTELSIEEIQLAKILYEMQKSKPKKLENELIWVSGAWEHLPEKCTPIIRDNISFYLKRLERTGLIYEITGGYINYSGGIYIISDTFIKLMEFLGGIDVSPNP